EALLLVGLAPLERPVGAHQARERLAVVAGVEDDEAHAAQHRALHALGDGVGDLGVGLVAPPQHHVGGVDDLLRQPVLRLAQGGDPHLGAGRVLEDRRPQLGVDAVGVDAAHALGLDLVEVLVVDGDPQGDPTLPGRQSVTAPTDALDTSLAYFASTPVV